MLTVGELAACLRVLRMLRAPQCSSVVLTWADDETRAYVRLARSGYVETVSAPAPRKASAPFRWDCVCATEAGIRYLEQIEAAEAVSRVSLEIKRAA